MKAKRTFYIGVFVLILSLIQFFTTFDPARAGGIIIGIFLMLFAWKCGWTKMRNLTALLGHLVLSAGCLVTAYGAYQIPFIEKSPSLPETFDLPLFWGLFSIFGGYCMIKHSCCSCVIKMHNENQGKTAGRQTLSKV